jgi:hypothetical protein
MASKLVSSHHGGAKKFRTRADGQYLSEKTNSFALNVHKKLEDVTCVF